MQIIVVVIVAWDKLERRNKSKQNLSFFIFTKDWKKEMKSNRKINTSFFLYEFTRKNFAYKYEHEQIFVYKPKHKLEIFNGKEQK